MPVSEALTRLQRELKPVASERVNLTDAVGRVLAEDVTSNTDLPPFSNSAMDGYAVKSRDVRQASEENPVVLSVVGDVPASASGSQALASGEALRIMTGAPLPAGSDAVVPVELTTNPEALAGQQVQDQIEVLAAVSAADHVRPAGQDVRAGDVVLQRGRRLRPADVGMLAALGVSEPGVYRIPKVAVLSTGDELLEVNEPLTPGHIRDSNGYALTAAVRSAGADPYRMGIAPDRLEAVLGSLERAVVNGADLILSSAGVSMGAHDYVRLALQERGELDFWKVNIRPGKPLTFGWYQGVPFLGLPGNPVSALITFDVFARTAIARLTGVSREHPWHIPAVLEEEVVSDGRESYLRAVVKKDGSSYRVRLTGSQDSGVLSSLIAANALLLVPEGIRLIPAGRQVKVWALSSSGCPAVWQEQENH